MQTIALSPLNIASPSVVMALDSHVREDLQNLGWMGHTFLWWLVASSIIVAAGVVLEGPEIAYELAPIVRRWIKRSPKRQKPRRAIQDALKVAGFAGWLLVVAGVVGEGIFEGLEDRAQGLLQTFNDVVLADSQRESAYAIDRAAENDKEASRLRDEEDGLEDDAAKAKRDMVEAQLELARLTGPVVVVAPVNGVARPNPMTGTKQRILLRSPTIIILPKLPKGKALDWTLMLTQDESGNRQFGTVPKVMPGGEAKSPFGNQLVLAPLSTCTLELTSDEHGTIDKTFGGASCPTTAISR